MKPARLGNVRTVAQASPIRRLLPPEEVAPTLLFLCSAANTAVTGEIIRASGGISLSMEYYALLYDVVDDYVERRSAYREEHLRLGTAAHRRGELLLAGALGDPPDGALLVFRTSERSIVEEFARNDPYVTHGLVTRWEVRPWAVVIGGEAEDRAG